MKYPIGIQNFGEIRRDGYVYVDKTALVYKMVSEGKYYFLSRPRRFGKSLLLSTIDAYLSGKRDLFKGLAIEQLEKEWEEYPILYLDLNTEKYDRTDALEKKLSWILQGWEKEYNCSQPEQSLGIRFENILASAYKKTSKRVVVLVDEYDKPLLQSIENEELQLEYRNTLKAFYGALKSCDRYIRFAFLTGVTKFGKVSVFSDLNNLVDISFDKRYAEICGITEKELKGNFDTSVEDLATTNNITKEECYKKLKEEYDGYHFSIDSDGLYNPFSVLNTLSSKQFSSYWFETGTPSFLVYQLKKTGYSLENITKESLSSDVLNSIDIMDENPLPLLYQSGYLTLKRYDSRFGEYKLGFPNKEVEQGFIKYLLPYYTPKVQDKSSFAVSRFVQDIEAGDSESFMRRMDEFFATGDYQIMGDLEIYFQNTIYVLFKLIGFYVDVERHTTRGRIDIVMQTEQYVYIMELKVDKSAKEALAQIEEKEYADTFKGDSRKVYKIGVNFDSKTRKIDEWKIV